MKEVGGRGRARGREVSNAWEFCWPAPYLMSRKRVHITRQHRIMTSFEGKYAWASSFLFKKKSSLPADRGSNNNPILKLKARCQPPEASSEKVVGGGGRGGGERKGASRCASLSHCTVMHIRGHAGINSNVLLIKDVPGRDLGTGVW